MEYFQTESDKLDRAYRLSQMIVKIYEPLKDESKRTSFKTKRIRKRRKQIEKLIGQLGYRYLMETDELKKIIPMPPVNKRRKLYAEAKDRFEKAKRLHKNYLEEYLKEKEKYIKIRAEYLGYDISTTE